jgi:pimeloyl-ACP methyl ester carboxylesterase
MKKNPVSFTLMFLTAATLAAAPTPAPAIGERHGNRTVAPGKDSQITQSRSTPLRRECDMPVLAELGRRYEALPCTTELTSTVRDGIEVRLALHRRGHGTNESLVIFLHGVLADHTTWCHLAGDLGEDHDLWLMDLPGCGASDKPKPSRLGRDGYSPTAMADRILQVLSLSLGERDAVAAPPTNIILVAHSLGGMTALRMFGDPDLRGRFAGVLGRIDRLVLLAPADVAVHAEMPAFMQVINFKDWQAAIARPLGLVKKASRENTRDGYQNPDCALQESARTLERVLSRPAERHAAQAMLRQAVPWHEKARRPDWEGIRRQAADYANVDVPTLIVWGARDEALPAAMGHKLKDDIRGAQLVRLEDCAHSIATEKPLECAQMIRGFMVARDLAELTRFPGGRHYPAVNRGETEIARR